jgi:STE24 endopeptidase
MSPRGWAAVTLAGLVVALVVVALLLVPWGRPAAPRADQLAALRTLPQAEVARGRAFHAALRPGGYGALAVGLLAALVLGLTPLGGRLVGLMGRPFGGHWIAQAVLGGLAVVLVADLLTLPFSAWRQAVVVRYGLSTQGWGGWTIDLLKSYAVSAVIGALALLGFYTVIRLAPRWWWALGAAGAAALVVLLSFILPVLVEPIFNRFTPMEPGPLRTELVALAARDGVPVRDVLVADASRRTRAVNAYVSGFGPTRRIVVYDTLLREAPPAEVTSVVAHELGHAKDRDVVTGTLIGALGAAAAVIGLYLLGSWGGLLRAAGVGSIAEPRALPLMIAIVTLVGLVAGPVQALVSRRVEARADAHALALTDDPVTFEAMQRRLSTVNLGDPDPPRWEYLYSASHPSTVRRMTPAPPRTLLVTNDFPPRVGGIQSFVHHLAIRQAPGSLVVYASTWRGADKFDADQPFEVVREPTRVLLPTPGVARRATELARAHGCDTVWFGAAAPLGLLAGGLRRRAGVDRVVGLTHGHEIGWAALPGARALLRRIARDADVLTYLSQYQRVRLDRALHGLTDLCRLTPGVDVEAYHPGVDGTPVRARYGLSDRPVVVCVSRLVPRKGQDALIRALPEIRRRVPGSALLVVGGGPYRGALEKLARRVGVERDVVLTGSVPAAELPAHYAAGDVYAMPCRTRNRGLDVEGLGIVYLEASASGLPVVAGDSGGAPDAVREGETGYVVDGRDVARLAERVAAPLADRELARRMGAAGRSWVEREWRWEIQARRLSGLLTGGRPQVPGAPAGEMSLDADDAV